MRQSGRSCPRPRDAPLRELGARGDASARGAPRVGPTRLFLAPTARSLPRGDGTIGLTEIGAPWGEVGLTDRVSLLGGATEAGPVLH